VAAARDAPVMRVASDVEDSLLSKRPGAALDAVLLRVVRVTAVRAAVDHVIQDQAAEFALFLW